MVDIYDLETGTWKTSASALPKPKSEMASVPYGDTFIIVGGRDAGLGKSLGDIFVFFTQATRHSTC